MKIEDIINSLTLEEKASILCGDAIMETKAIPEKGVAPLIMSDGPNGVRRISDSSGFNLNDPIPATSFPTGSTTAQSWDKSLLYEIGEGIAKECQYFGIQTILGPAFNIKRNPLCGRNFEYFSEDPLLSGYLASSYVKGVQDNHVFATIKHYACNNNERWRYTGDSIVDERALREIYLKPFEITIRESNPKAIMTSYNKINGEHASQNYHIHKEILRDEWKYDGLSMSDWGGMDDRLISLINGQDLEMPGCIEQNVQKIIDGYNNGLVSMDVIDKSLYRILKLVEEGQKLPKRGEEVFDENKELSIKAAKESMVLLKNKDNILPLSNDKTYSIVGEYFKKPRFQGGGSSLINPVRYSTPENYFFQENVKYVYSVGFYDNEDFANRELEEEAYNNSKDKDVILLFIGQTDYYESESYDRDNMSLPRNQISLIERLKELHKPIVLVLFGGSMVEIPYLDDIDAILFVGLPGECSGDPIYSTLFGKNNPSGRLTESWIYKYNDHITSETFAKEIQELYKESIYVGYRYYNSADIKVMFPFGYGLSYSKFEYRDLKITQDKDGLIIKVKVKNISNIPGKDVIQIYISKPDSKTYRPNKELKGFDKLYLDVKEEKEAEIHIKYDDLKVFDITKNQFVLEDGKYIIHISKNVNEDILKEEIVVKGEKLSDIKEDVLKTYKDVRNLKNVTKEQFEELYGKEIPNYVPKGKPYDFYTPLCEMNSFFGKIVRNMIANQGIDIMEKAKKRPPSLSRQRQLVTGMMVAKGQECACLRSICYSSAGAFTYKQAEGVLDIANGHPIRGFRKFKS